MPSVPASGPAASAATEHEAAAAPADRSADAVDAGRGLFDQGSALPLADFLKEHAGRPLDGVFIQQEHEGSLIFPDPKDSSGNVFRYYRPVEMRPDLAAQVNGEITGFSRFLYGTRRAFQFRGRGTPEAEWRAWSVDSKLNYLDRLEKAVTAERGPQAAWDGKVSLILERKPGAPGYVTKNPHMEAPPEDRRGEVGARFLQPEIVTAKDSPAGTIGLALGRAASIIADTGHAGVQFHVFVKAEPRALLAQMANLDGAMQIVNDALFAKAAASSDKNLLHPSLLPWHRGRSERVRSLLTAAGADPSVPVAEDPDSEKHAFVGFRYWGLEDGKAVVSFELRGASLPWKRNPNRMVQGIDTNETPKRDYTEVRTYLTFLALYAEALARGEAPRAPARSAALDAPAAESYLRALATELGVPTASYDGLAALTLRLTHETTLPQSYLFPFAADAGSPDLRTFAVRTLNIAARAKAAEESGSSGALAQERYEFWLAYRAWALGFSARQEKRLEALARASAR